MLVKFNLLLHLPILQHQPSEHFVQENQVQVQPIECQVSDRADLDLSGIIINERQFHNNIMQNLANENDQMQIERQFHKISQIPDNQQLGDTASSAQKIIEITQHNIIPNEQTLYEEDETSEEVDSIYEQEDSSYDEDDSIHEQENNSHDENDSIHEQNNSIHEEEDSTYEEDNTHKEDSLQKVQLVDISLQDDNQLNNIYFQDIIQQTNDYHIEKYGAQLANSYQSKQKDILLEDDAIVTEDDIIQYYTKSNSTSLLDEKIGHYYYQHSNDSCSSSVMTMFDASMKKRSMPNLSVKFGKTAMPIFSPFSELNHKSLFKKVKSTLSKKHKKLLLTTF